MSHQDTDHVSTNAQDLQAVLDWLVPQQTLADISFETECLDAIHADLRGVDVVLVRQADPHQTLCRSP